MVFVKLTLSSNDLPTFINVEAIQQLYGDTDRNGNFCTRIDFSNDYTKVSESMDVVILKIAKAKLNSKFGRFNGFYVDTDSEKVISSFTIHDKSEENYLNPMYGMDTYSITEHDIEALLDGKILYSDKNGEYATLIELEREE